MTKPALSIDAGPKVGRLYRRPGDPLPAGATSDAATGSVSISKRKAEDAVRGGLLVPSITNVLGVRNAPHLVPWAAKTVAAEAIRVARHFPDRLTAAPDKALAYLKGAADRDRDAAAAQGDAVHNAAEAAARGEKIPALSPAQQPFMDSWNAWADAWQPEFLAIEATVYGTITMPDGTVRRYAGTGDAIIRCAGMTIVLDYKTNRSGLHDDAALQVSAIAHAGEITTDYETLSPMPQIDAGIAVHLSADGYQVKPCVIDGEPWDLFGHLRALWDFQVFDGTLADGTPVLGRSIRGPGDLVPRNALRPVPAAA